MLSFKFTKSDVPSTLFRWEGPDRILEVSSDLDNLVVKVISVSSGNLLESSYTPFNDSYRLREFKLMPDGKIYVENELAYDIVNNLPSGGVIRVGNEWQGGVRDVSSTFPNTILEKTETLSDNFEVLTSNWGTFYQVPLIDPAPGPILSFVNSTLPPPDMSTAYGKVWLGLVSASQNRVFARLYYLTNNSGDQISVGTTAGSSPQMKLFAAWPLNSKKPVRDFSTDFTTYGEPRLVVVYGDGILISYDLYGYSRISTSSHYLHSVKSAKLFPSALLYGTVPSDLYLFVLDVDNRLWSYNLSTLSRPDVLDMKPAISELGTRFEGADVRIETIVPLSSSDDLLEIVFHSIDYPNRRLYASMIYSPSDLWFWIDDTYSSGSTIWIGDEEGLQNPPVWRV